MYNVQAQTVVHGPCVRPMPLLWNQALQSASTLSLCIHAICINYSLTTLWHLPDYVSNLCICNWLPGFNNSCPQSLVILVDCRVLLLNYLLQSIPYLLNWTQIWWKRWPPNQTNFICCKLLFDILDCMFRPIILLKLKSWMWLKIFVKWRNNSLRVRESIDLFSTLFSEYI